MGVGDGVGAGWALGLLAYIRFFQRRFPDAELLATRVRTEALELGDTWAPAMMDSLLASIRLWSGRFTEAEELAGVLILNDVAHGSMFVARWLRTIREVT